MQIADAVDELNRRLLELRARRERAAQESEALTREQGATIALLRDHYGQSQAVSARKLGLSVAAVSDLVAKARAADTQIVDPITQILCVTSSKALEYVSANDQRVDRVAASFVEDDLLFMTDLHPSAFARPESTELRIPHMAWHLEPSDQWIGITNVTVGYAGSGPSAAQNCLQKVLGEDLATAIVNHRVSSVDLNNRHDDLFTRQWPLFHLSPLEFHGNYLSTTFSLEERPYDGMLMQKFDTGSGFYPEEPAGSLLSRWTALLNSPTRPGWLTGGRRGRLYLDESASAADGFGHHQYMGGDFFGLYDDSIRIVIEQGDLQLRLRANLPLDSSCYLSDEEYAALDELDLFPTRMRSLDRQHRWIRTLRKKFDTGAVPARLALGEDIIHLP